MVDKAPSASGFRFELTGGALCFDFANTVDSRCAPKQRVDNLTGFTALAEWARQSGVVSARKAGELSRTAKKQPDATGRVFRKAVELRETIYRVFSAIAGGDRPSGRDLLLLGSYAQEACSHMHLIGGGSGFEWRLDQRSRGSPMTLLWPIAKSGVDLLVSGDLARVRECAAGNCGWLFMDRSRNQSRRWCDMKICGNREKVWRHRRSAVGRQATP
ncbi:MAG: CGNR zinc finger domain-containing protein [Terriglobales bacterium]